jgi:hypothetical protein
MSMKQYQQLDENGESFQIGGLSIPVDPGNRDYARMQDEIAAGEAEVLPYVEPAPTWQDNRIAAYGSWREQLDQMFHGTWEDHVAAVKAAHPKP